MSGRRVGGAALRQQVLPAESATDVAPTGFARALRGVRSADEPVRDELVRDAAFRRGHASRPRGEWTSVAELRAVPQY